MKIVTTILGVSYFFIYFFASAQIPETISYQGFLRDADRKPINGNYDITFKIYDDSTGNEELWSEKHNSVQIKNGVFNVILGKTADFSSNGLNFDKCYYLGIQVGLNSEFNERISLTSSPYSISAKSIKGSENTFPSSGNVGIGILEPGEKLQVAGTIHSLSGGFMFPDGSVQKVATDSGAAIWKRSEDKVYFDGGNVGIGTTDPFQGGLYIGTDSLITQSVKLHLKGDGDQIVLEDSRGEANERLWIIKANGGMMEIVTAADKWDSFLAALQLKRNSDSVSQVLFPNGNVGIGIDFPNPSEKLVVGGTIQSTRGGFKFPDGSTQISAASSNITAWKSSGYDIYYNSGNVGIGTNAPNEQLEINGNFRLPATTDSSAGIIFSGEHRFIHRFGDVGNVFLGVQAGNFDLSGVNNTGLGFRALHSSTNGSLNTAVGWNSLQANNAGSHNTAVGWQSLSDNGYGSYNTAIGTEAALNNTTGDNNTAVAAFALKNNTTGVSNTAIGIAALSKNDSGDNNTAVAAYALENNTTGINNTAIGNSALRRNDSGTNNTAVGDSSLVNNSSGTFNSAFGARADIAAGYIDNATAIGANAVVDASNKVRIGDTNVTVIQGEVDFTFTSDSTKKEKFMPISGEYVLEKISKFRIGSWNFKGQNPIRARHYGPYAQDFYAAFGFDGVGTIGSDTTLCGSDVAGINMISIQALEKRSAEQRKIIEKLQTTIATIQNDYTRAQQEIEELKTRVTIFESTVKRLEVFLLNQNELAVAENEVGLLREK